jgi:hypothetical protein
MKILQDTAHLAKGPTLSGGLLKLLGQLFGLPAVRLFGGTLFSAPIKICETRRPEGRVGMFPDRGHDQRKVRTRVRTSGFISGCPAKSEILALPCKSRVSDVLKHPHTTPW